MYACCSECFLCAKVLCTPSGPTTDTTYFFIDVPSLHLASYLSKFRERCRLADSIVQDILGDRAVFRVDFKWRTKRASSF